jgi:hypothetical protein
MSENSYEMRLRIPVSGDAQKCLYTKMGLLLMSGYKRIVIGARGPYVECEISQLNNAVLRESSESHYYYLELRSEPDDVKIYIQAKPVNYADYVPGMCYVSPFELFDENGVILIDPLPRRHG